MPADLIELHEYEEAIGIGNIVTNSLRKMDNFARSGEVLM